MKTLCLALVVSALLVVGCGGPRIDPKWEEAATNYLNDVEILAKFSRFDSAGWAEREQKVQESHIRIPKSDQEPMATLQKAFANLNAGCISMELARQRDEITGARENKKFDRASSAVLREVEALRHAIKKGEAYSIPATVMWSEG